MWPQAEALSPGRLAPQPPSTSDAGPLTSEREAKRHVHGWRMKQQQQAAAQELQLMQQQHGTQQTNLDRVRRSMEQAVGAPGQIAAAAQQAQEGVLANPQFSQSAESISVHRYVFSRWWLAAHLASIMPCVVSAIHAIAQAGA